MTFKSIMAPHVTAMTPEPATISVGGRLTMPVRVILFDIYGTLLISASGDIGMTDTQPRSGKRLELLLQKYDVQSTVPDLMDKYFKAVIKAHDLMKENGIDFPEIQVDRIWMQILRTHDPESARRFAVEFEMITNPVRPMPHARETVDILRRQGIILGIISNAQFYTPYLFDLFFNNSVQAMGFEPGLIFYSYVYGHAKPSPMMFQRAVEQINKMGFEPKSSVYVGNDMKNDILPAQSAGFQTVLFAGDRRSLRLRETDPDCKNVTPDLVIIDLMQLPTYLNTQF